MIMKTKIFLASVLVVMACSEKKGSETTEDITAQDTVAVAEKVAADTVKADAVTSATNVANSPTFNGVIMVSPQRMATLSLTMGGKVHTMNVMPGQRVARGQVVATIDNPEFIELQQTYLEAQAQTEYLEKEYQRQCALGEQDATSRKKVQQSKAEYLSMKSRLSASTARLKALGVNISSLHDKGIMAYLPVTSPITGYVTNVTANIGKYLDAGEPLCDVIDKSAPLLQLTVYEKDLPMMRVGRKALFRVNGMGKKTFEAEVVSIDQSIDSKDYSVKVYAQVKTVQNEFRPGMYVRAKLLDIENKEQ